MKALYVTLFALLGTIGLTACNTLEGVGEDLQQGGEALEDAANE